MAGADGTKGAVGLAAHVSLRNGDWAMDSGTPPSVCKPLPAKGLRYLPRTEETTEAVWDGTKDCGGLGVNAGVASGSGWTKSPQASVSGIDPARRGVGVAPPWGPACEESF